MELRFILEHAEASVEAARKMHNTIDRESCIRILKDLGRWLTDRMAAGVKKPPNVDIKPAEPG